MLVKKKKVVKVSILCVVEGRVTVVGVGGPEGVLTRCVWRSLGVGVMMYVGMCVSF